MQWRDRSGTERRLSDLAEPPPGAGSKKTSLYESNLLRKKGLGLILRETGLQEPAWAGWVGRTSWEGVKATVPVLSEAGRRKKAW